MHIEAPAIICATLPHGEHGAAVRAMTAEHGLMVGYARFARATAMRPVLIAGNIVAGVWRARGTASLPSFTAELIASRAAVHGEPLAAAALDWVTALTAATLPETYPYPALYAALDGVCQAIAIAPTARGWAAAIVLYELLLLRELGFGLDLSSCAVTGALDDLRWVSPRSARAVCGVAATGFEPRLLALPRFVIDGTSIPSATEIAQGFALTGHFVEHSLFADRRRDVFAARARLTDRFARLLG